LDPWCQDVALARRCLAGDEAAWRTLVAEHGPRIFSLCLARGLPPSDAEDVCQEVLVSALRGLRRFGGCRLSTWLYRITQRRLADHFRSRGRADALGLPGDPTFPARADPAPVGPDAESIGSAERERVRRAVAATDEPMRSILLAYYVGGLSVREIAREHRMPENTVKSHLRRGRMSVRERLEQGC
jgi:RNA polymerase sigma-70 factor (ECF subfamily)